MEICMTASKIRLNKQNVSLSNLDVNQIMDYGFEDKILRNVERQKFYDYFKANKINLNKILHGQPTENEIYKFNVIIEILNEYGIINIVSSLLFLDEDFIRSKKVYNLLNDNNKSQLKEILQKRNINRLHKFKNRVEKNKLDLFIEESVDRIDIDKNLEISINGILLKDK